MKHHPATVFSFCKIKIAPLLFASLVGMSTSTHAVCQTKQPVLSIPVGHQQKINSVAFSADGKLIASGSGDNSFIIWDARTGFAIRRVNTGGPVQQVIFSPDGSYLITVTGQDVALASANKPILKKWDTRTGRMLMQLPFTASTGLTYLASSGNLCVPGYSEDLSAQKNELANSTIMMNDPQKYAQQYMSTINYDSIEKAAQKQAEEMIKKMKGKDMTDKKNIEELNKMLMTQFSAQMSSVMASNPLYKTFTLVDRNSFKVVDRLNGSFDKARPLSYNNSDYLVAAEIDADPYAASRVNINIWDVKSLAAAANNTKPAPWKKFGIGQQPRLLVTSPQKGFFATDTGRKAVVQLWQLDRNSLLTLLKPKGETVDNMEFSSDGNTIYVYSKTVVVLSTTTTSVNSYIEAWSTQTFQNVLSVELPKSYNFYTFNLSPTGNYFIAVNGKNMARLSRSGKIEEKFGGRSTSPSYFGFSPDDRHVYINYNGYPDMNEFFSLAIQAGIEHDAFLNKKVLTKEEKEKQVKQRLKLYGAAMARDYDGYNLFWDLARGGAGRQKADTFSTNHRVITANKNYLLFNEQSESGNRESNPYLSQLVPKSTEGISKETSDQLKKYLDTGSLYYKILFADRFNGPVTSLVNKKTSDTISLIKIDSLDWVMVLKNGYYMSSKNGARALSYVSDLDVFPFEQLDTRYNRPDMVLTAIGMSDAALIEAYRKAYQKRIKKLGIDTTQFRMGFQLPEADFKERAQVEREQHTDKLRLAIHAQDNKNTLERFNIWVNEVPLYGSKGISLRKRNKNSFDTTVTVILSQDENKIETSVTNANGMESYRDPLYVNYIPAEPEKQKTYFIGIGIDNFAQSEYNLQWSAKDVRDIALNLKNKYRENIEIDTLFNEHVTVSNVKSLKQKLQNTSVNDKVIVAYSGHGLLSRNYDYYLSTYSINFNQPEQNGLPYDELENLLDSIPARKKLMLIDACHSGEIDKEEMQQYASVQNKLDSVKGVILKIKDSSKIGMKNSFELMQELFVNVGKSTGATIISAAAGTQFALEKSNLKNGVFTYSILEYMQQHDHATLSELKQYVNARVPELTQGLQVPTSRSETIDVDWEVW